MSKTPPDAEKAENPSEQTSSGESLDIVLSSIREAITSHAESGQSGSDRRSSSLALAFDDLRREITHLREKMEGQPSAPVMSASELEALIEKIIRPMMEIILKAWLERNLPPLAERLIREEIEKLSRE